LFSTSDTVSIQVLHDGDDPIFHRDIRWPNIIRLPPCALGEPSKWILIDWDDSSGFPTQPAKHLNSENHAPEVFQEHHHGEVDVWGVGKLIIEASKWIIGLSLDIIKFGQCMQGDNRPTARDALKKLKYLTY